jgi:enterochelin esterase-like enzyme
MKRIFLPLCLLLLAGCAAPVTPAPAATPPAAPFTCDTPGSFELLDLPRAKGESGYKYSVYLPPCYAADTDRVYPVLYLFPGRTSGPMTWYNAGSAKVADELILSGQVQPFIIVSTQDIDNDPTVSVILNEVIPYVERTYRVSPERRHHEVAGGSLGSIAAYRVAFQNPDKFSSVGMFGGGAIHGEEEKIKGWLATMTPENRPLVYLNSGWDDPLMVDRAYVMMDILDEFDVRHIHVFTQGDHSYAYWIYYLPDYIQWAAQDW